MKIPPTPATIILVSLLSIAALLCACATQVDTPPSANTLAAKPPAPAGDKIVGGVGVSFLILDQHAAPPAACDAAIYGSITAAPGVGLCVCQPQPDGQRGDWVQAISRQACWPDDK